MAGIIDNLLVEDTPPTIGESLAKEGIYFAQTFVAEGDRMQSLDFLINGLGPNDTKYHVLVTSVEDLPGGQFQPGEVLMEVEGLVAPFDTDPSLHQVHLNLKGLELEDGKTYAFIFDTHVTEDGAADIAAMGVNDNYGGGSVSILLPGGLSREAAFNSDWLEAPMGEDFAFKAVFSDEGETITGNKKDNKKLKGTDDDDTIIGKAGKDKLRGLDGFDELNGGKDDDKLIGGNDGDKLIGGKGNDILKGGPGEDCYFFDFKMTKKSAKQNYDKIKGFDTEDDAIYLKESRFDLPLGDYDSAANGLTYTNGKLKYEGKMIAEFTGGSKPDSLEDIHIVVYA